MSPEDISVYNILKELGKPTEASEFFDVVAKKLNKGPRQAKREVKKAWENGEIRKIPLPDRGVLYACPEWSISKEFQDAFYYFALEELKLIAHENLYGRHMMAFQRLRHLKARQSEKLQKKLYSPFGEAVKAIKKAITTRPYEQKEEIIREVNLMLISEFSILLHELIEKETP